MTIQDGQRNGLDQQGPVAAAARCRRRRAARAVLGVCGLFGLLGGTSVAQSPAQTTAPWTADGSHGPPDLPAQAGQVWRDYDLTSFAQTVPDGGEPQRDVREWILRDTGTEVWMEGPLAVLHVDRRQVRVYHTPEIQAKVGAIVDRFNSPHAQAKMLSVRLLSVGHPDWRLRVQRSLEPVPVQTPGVEAWLLAREEAARLLAELRQRTDFHEFSAAQVVVAHGQSHTVQELAPRSYAKTLHLTGATWPGYELERAEVHEGYVLHVSPLFSADGAIAEVALEARADQLEQLHSLWVDVPTLADPRQRVAIQVPQLAGWRLSERFRWPADKVLLVSPGVVAPPTPAASTSLLPVPRPFAGPERAEALVLLEPKTAVRHDRGAPAARTTRLDSRGRY